MGTHADAFIVPGIQNGTPACWLVAKDANRIEIHPRMLADGNNAARVLLNHSEAKLLGSGEAMRDAFARARAAADIAASAYQLGLAETMLAMTIDYTSTREQFGQAIGSFQSLQHRLVNCYIALRLTDACVNECAGAADRSENSNAMTFAASRSAHRAAETLSLISREAIQLHGALGYSTDTPLAAWYTHIRSQRLVDGPDEVHKWVTGKNVIRAFKKDGTTAAAAGGDLL